MTVDTSDWEDLKPPRQSVLKRDRNLLIVKAAQKIVEEATGESETETLTVAAFQSSI